jgi:hypothetical protein
VCRNKFRLERLSWFRDLSRASISNRTMEKMNDIYVLKGKTIEDGSVIGAPFFLAVSRKTYKLVDFLVGKASK